MQSCIYVEEITTFKHQHIANARIIACNWILSGWQTCFCHLSYTISIQLYNKQFGGSKCCCTYCSLKKIINRSVFITRQLCQPVSKVICNLNSYYTQYHFFGKLNILYNIKPDIFPTRGHSVIIDPQAMQCLQCLCAHPERGPRNTRLLAILVTLHFYNGTVHSSKIITCFHTFISHHTSFKGLQEVISLLLEAYEI